MSGWRLALRLARREALRARGRSVLVLVMIALPVLGVTAADVVIATSAVSGAEAVERRLGTADARVVFDPGAGRVAQTADPDTGSSGWLGRRKGPPATLDTVRDALGRDVRALEVRTGQARVTTGQGIATLEAVETDLRDPLAEGTYTLDSGRLPTATDEVLVNSTLAARGFGPGDAFDLRDGRTLTVVGVGDNASYRGYPIAVAPPGGFGLRLRAGEHTWLVDAGGPVTWDDVLRLNAVGGMVLSREVLGHPPSNAELSPEMQGTGSSTDSSIIAVIALIVVMALLEVVLLAGPAFAVGARRLSRSLALMAASGATPRQSRRVVLASGLVLGGAGALLGTGLGLLVAWLSLPAVQHFSNSFLGPYDVPWPHLAGIAGFGLVSALLAAVVPAWIASRQDVVAVLAGRRGDRPASRRSPVLGVVLLATGIAGAAYGATADSGEFFIAGSAIVCVLGMILLVPVVLRLVAALGRRLPLPLRFAARDANRHRTRTVPAVAAVAATVAGVVALGIGNASDAAQNRGDYVAELPVGQAVLSAYGRQPDWDAYAALARQYLPGAEVTPVQGVSDRGTTLGLRAPSGGPLRLTAGSRFDTSYLVSDEVPAPVTELSDAQRRTAQAVLARGGVVVFTQRPRTDGTVRATLRRVGADHHRARRLGQAELPAAYVATSRGYGRFMAILSTQAADRLGLEPTTVGLVVAGASITSAQEQDVTEALAGISPKLSFYVERGYQNGDDTVVLLLVLGALGAVLMLGGTLTATFLALSDARPDLATLAAVGASPRTRRGVAAAYAAVVGLVGAMLGAAVGFVPGVAISFPLTQRVQGSGPSHYLDVPWLLVLGLVLVLPLVTTAVVGLCTRSRLPLVARLD